MNATEILNQAADLIEKVGWRPADGHGTCIGNAVYSTWRINRPNGVFLEIFGAVEEVIGVDTLADLWRWNDTVCLDQAEAVNTIRKAAENVEAMTP